MPVTYHLPVRPPLWAIGMISAAALAYEILLIRLFAIVHGHHSVEIVISLALLGYGASGTLLSLLGDRVRRHAVTVFVANAMLFGLSALVCVLVAQSLPFDPMAAASDRAQVWSLAAMFVLLSVPLFAAANSIGSMLWCFEAQIPRIYGVDLLGAGAGALLVLPGLWLLHPQALLLVVSLAALVSAGLASRLLAARTPWLWVLSVAATGLIGLLFGLSSGSVALMQPAPYKDMARALATEGVVIEHASSGPAGSLTVLRNEQVPFRYAPGLSLQSLAVPPAVAAVFVDGDRVGARPLADGQADDSEYQRDRLSALPYLLLEAPRTAVLRAGGGDAVAQSVALGAGDIVAVEPNPQLVALNCDAAGACAYPRVDWQTQSERAFIATSKKRFDLVRLDVAPDIAGLDALSIDFGLTREAMSGYLDILEPDGLLVINGPLRYPPALSIRLLATARDALLERGHTSPARHIAMLRGWRDFTLLVSPRPLTDRHDAAIRTFAERLGFDLVWLAAMTADDANRYRQLPRPAYFEGALAVLAAAPAAGAGIGPASDDRPYPYRFSEWGAAARLLLDLFSGREAAAQRGVDVGVVLGMLTVAVAAVSALVLIVLPLLLGSSISRAPTGVRLRVLVYFAGIGVAFLFVEIAWIQRLRLFIGQPVLAATTVLAAFLVFAGLGSLWSQRRRVETERRVLWLAVSVIGLLSLFYLSELSAWLHHWSMLPTAGRMLVAFLLMAPLAFGMGIPFPLGLRYFSRDSTGIVPWAWAINGSASVISAAVAPLVAASAGFSGMVVLAVLCYVAIAALLPAHRITAR
jgi:spermidine synthase